jgi:hypothetical protein
MSLTMPSHKLSLVNNPVSRCKHQSPKGRALLRRAGCVLVGLPALILVLVLAGAVYQAVVSVLVLALALADEIYRGVTVPQRM